MTGKKPLEERSWVHAAGGIALLAFAAGAWMLDNYNYHLWWVAMPAGLAAAWPIVARQAAARRESRLTRVAAAIILMPVLAWPIWVVANLANQFRLHDPVQRHAAVTGYGESFLHSGRGAKRYTLAAKLEDSGKTLEFVVEWKGGTFAPIEPVCEWRGLLGFTTFTLGRCGDNKKQ